MRIILWADEPNHALAVRDVLRDQNHVPMIRDARFFQGIADAEKADAIAFVNATKRDDILVAYRSEVYQTRHGDVRVLDIETGEFGEPLAVPDLNIDAPPPPPTEKDFLTERLENLSDADLRTFARATIGADIPAEATREDIEKMLRTGEAPAAKPAPGGVEAAAPPPAPPADALDLAPPPPAEEAPPADAPPSGRGSKNKTKPAS